MTAILEVFIQHLLCSRSYGYSGKQDSTYILVFFIWNNFVPWVPHIYFQLQGKEIATACPVVQSLQLLHILPSAHIILPFLLPPPFPSPSVGSAIGMPAQQSNPGKLTAQLTKEVSISS